MLDLELGVEPASERGRAKIERARVAVAKDDPFELRGQSCVRVLEDRANLTREHIELVSDRVLVVGTRHPRRRQDLVCKRRETDQPLTLVAAEGHAPSLTLYWKPDCAVVLAQVMYVARSHMEFRILGPLEVLDDGHALPLGSARQRALLAALLLRPNQPVSVDRLIDDLWGERPPKTAPHVIQVYISGLRKVVGEDVIVTRKPGYLLRIADEQLDLFRFEQLAERGRRALEAGDAEQAAQSLREALALWHGPPLADFPYEPFMQQAIARLDELRLAVIEERIEADIRLGRHAELAAELEMLVREHPLRERPCGQLMLVLYRGGRQAEALTVYQGARAALLDGLGLDPSPALQELERAILRQDASLQLPEHADRAHAPLAPTARRSARAILLAPRGDDELESLLSFGELLARALPPHELILLPLLEPRWRGLSTATAELQRRRSDLASRGVSARVAAFTSDGPAADVLRMAGQQDVDLLLLERPEAAGDVDEPLRAILENAPCDVALRIGGAATFALDGSVVLVPFGGDEHDWAALEFGAWAASALGSSLRLVGVEGDPGATRRDASRLLATAALAVQQMVGIATEPLLVPPGPSGVLDAAEAAHLIACGLPTDWSTRGIGEGRALMAARARPPMFAVRRGVRPGGMSPPEGLTRFTWSVAAA